MFAVRFAAATVLLLQASALNGNALAASPITPASSRVVPGLSEPLVATSATSSDEDRALSAALSRFATRSDAGDLAGLTAFATQYPHSGWTAAVETNVGLSYLHDGYFSRALEAWQTAWREGRDAKDPAAKAMVDRAVGELARLQANLGHTEQLASLVNDIGARPIGGSATEAIQTAREQLSLVNVDPRHLFICGPLALRSLLLAEHKGPDDLNFLQFYNAGTEGTTLAELSGLADRAKLSHRLARRDVGQAVPVPSVVHWKVGHFAAILSKANGRYEVQDAVFPGSEIWVTQAALDEEASGYFLVPASTVSDRNWKAVDLAEAHSVRGKGQTFGTRPGGAGDVKSNTPAPKSPIPNQPSTGQNNQPNPTCGMCTYSILESSVSVSLSDVPVGYVPPIGPSLKIGISYNQREDSQPANFSYYNVGPKWTLGWLSYVIDDPTNPGANVSRIMGEGGAFYYNGYSSSQKSFAAQDDDGSILAIASQLPIIYRRLLRDGTIEVYSQADGSAAYPRKIFLSQVIDPQGNAATLHYDASLKLTSITDATNRDTTFSYGVSGQPLLVSKVTDPFGRSAFLGYDSAGRLSSITDTIGLTSRFSYDANSLVNSMTTPYGTTQFSYTAPGTSTPPRFVQVTDPLGFKEREEWLEPAPIPDSDPPSTVPAGMPIGVSNSYLTYRNSFHWDKDAYVAAGCTDTGGCDYTKARLRHFVHMPGTEIKGTGIESEKNALENRVWYNYPGQTSSIGALYGGTYNEPIAMGRVLDDGTTQLTQYAYDSTGYNLTQEIDPSGRVTSYAYSNNVDLAAITQKTGVGATSMLAQYIYNGVHRPTYYTDASGQTTTYEYNSLGQLTKSTDPLSGQTTWQYDGNDNLASETNANGVVAKSYTYDAANRVRTFTDSEGWSVSSSYDDADRVTKITYPDGTADRYTYNRLDLASHKDREGRLWQYVYDANRRLTSIIDPLRAQTLLGYNDRGQITSLTDPKGNVTAWAYDIEGRVVSKTYADTSVVAYNYENTTSRLKSTLDALGQTKQYGYAIDDALTGLTYLNAVNPTPNVTFSYDPYFQRVAAMTDGSGTTTYSYFPSFANGAQQLHEECYTATGGTGCSHEIDYVYDSLARLATRTISGSRPESFSYDTLGRLTGHVSDLGSFALSYLGQTSQLTQRQLLPTTSNLKTTWSYLDNAHDRRLASISNAGLSAAQFTNFTFQTSPENEITRIEQSSDATVSYPTPTAQTIAVNNLNEITDVSGESYSYDGDGNLTSDGHRTYSWDAENRLVGITYASIPQQATQFAYDGLGRRIAMDETPAGGESAVSARYAWCGSTLCQKRNAAYSVIRAYLDEGEFAFGTADPPLFYGLDQIGSVRRVFESTTNAPAYDYDPWGSPLQSTAPSTDFGFAKLLASPIDGIGLTWFRAYKPNIGRWISRDPLGEDSNQSSNIYAYADSSPTNRIDPTGELSLLPPWMVPWPKPQPSPNFCPVPNGVPDPSAPLFSDKAPGDPPYSGQTPDDKAMGRGPGGTKKDPDNGSIWDKDYSQHGGTKWKRWPDQKAWEKGRGRESVRPDGSTRGD